MFLAEDIAGEVVGECLDGLPKGPLACSVERLCVRDDAFGAGVGVEVSGTRNVIDGRGHRGCVAEGRLLFVVAGLCLADLGVGTGLRRVTVYGVLRMGGGANVLAGDEGVQFVLSGG